MTATFALVDVVYRVGCMAFIGELLGVDGISAIFGVGGVWNEGESKGNARMWDNRPRVLT